MATEETTTTTTENVMINTVSPEFLCGRLDIFSSVDEINADTVVAEVNSAITFHNTNLISEEYLYWYRRGLQPILNRTKDRNTYVLTKCIENHAQEICAFKSGYFLQQPATYVSRRKGVQGKIDKLNEYVYRSGKYEVDNKVADWFHTVGKGVLYIKETFDKDIPFRCYSLDPRSAFVVKSMQPGNEPLYGVNIVTRNQVAYIDAYTNEYIYRLSGGYTGQKTTAFPNYQTLALHLDRVERNPLGHIPIIEYRYDSVNMGAFESVISLLDCINQVQSGRIDGVEQFIQSVIVAVNCQFEEGTTADEIKKQGMILLSSIGENKADFKILSEELNQDQTQTLVDNLYDQVLRICSMPSTTKGGRSTSDTGSAVIFRDGWEQAASACRNTEDLWKQSDQYFREIVLDILERRGLLKNLSMVDFDVNFVRAETANIQSKAQAFQTLLSAGLHPELAAKKSGVSNDPVSDIRMSEPYLKMIWGDPTVADKTEETDGGEGEAVIIEEDNDNGENATI
jgi:SPP1 family phage portal protein